jgi:cobalt-zinc-cadmium resistance protein CzcA
MIEALIGSAYRLRWVVLLFAALIAGAGVVAFRYSKIEAYPDISGVSVVIITQFSGRSPEDVERQVTAPIELAMGSVPKVETIRSRTIFGLSVIVIEFEDGVELYWARQRVQEQLNTLNSLPKNVSPTIGPPISSAGEILRYEVRGDGTLPLMELRTLHDWVITPRLLRVPGVGDVANFGGDAKQFAVIVNPVQMQRFGVSLSDLVDAVSKNNSTSGGSVVRRGSMSFVIRGRGAVRDEREIGNIFVKSIGGTPVYLRELADVRVEPKVPTGIFGRDFREQTESGEVITRHDHSIEGLITIRKGENPSAVLEKLKEAIGELNGGELPPGARVELFYDRSELINTTLGTVGESVGLGIGLVVLVLLFFLGSPRMAGIVSLTIPFSLLFALLMMFATKIPVGLLSIGAIDFGIIVDGAVIVADHLAHKLGQLPRGADRKFVRRVILDATLEVQRPVFFSVLMIIAVHLPLLTLVRIEGLLFRPMAITIVFALIGCLIFALLAVPALAAVLFPHGYREWINPLLRLAKPIYAWTLRGLLRLRWLVAPLALILLAGIVYWLAHRLGTEFLPYMDEGTIWLRANFAEGQSIEQTAEFANRIRHIALEFPDIAFATSRAGRTDSGLDPFPASRLEMMIGPKPRDQWTQFKTKHELIAALATRLRAEFPTTRFNFTQPIIDNVTEEVNGTSANLAVEFSGADPFVLQDLGQKTVAMLNSIPGAQDVAIEQEGPQPQLVIEPDRALCARYNVRIEDVNALVNTALGGDPVANLYEGERLFDIVVKFDRQGLNSPKAVAKLPVFTSDGIPVPLGQVAKVTEKDGQTLIARESGRRRITVRCDIAGRDQGGFVAEAQERFEEEIRPEVPAGYRVNWIGMFQNLARAKDHFAIVGPITIGLLVILLIITLGSVRSALAVLLALPGAFIGGAVAIYLRGMNLNVSVMVGFAALFGVSIMNGVLMVQRITRLRREGMEVEDAICRGAQDLLRPITMASLVAMLGLLPASMATGLGSDVQRPLATVIVWGLFSSTTLTLFLVPVFYRLLEPPLPQPKGHDDELLQAVPIMSHESVA